MNWFAFFRISLCRGALLGCAIALGCATFGQASAAAGPFAEFPGSWSGNGKIRIGDKTERIRCKSKYSLQGSNERYVVLQIACASDSYKFDLSGNFQADESNHITGFWSELSRNVHGEAAGVAQGDRFQVHIDSQAFSGNLTMVTHGGRQLVSIDTIGTKDNISASITLHRGSR
jgi:hypothetical protein